MLARWGVGLTILFLLPVLFIRAQPYDDAGLAALLHNAPDCPQPCTPGIDNRLLIPMRVSLGAVRLALGSPERITLTTNGGRRPRAAFVLEYPARALHVYAEFRLCEINPAAFWQMGIGESQAGGFYVGTGRPDYIRVMPNRPVELDPHHWAKELRDFCRP